jgi:hypothetical protein
MCCKAIDLLPYDNGLTREKNCQTYSTSEVCLPLECEIDSVLNGRVLRFRPWSATHEAGTASCDMQDMMIGMKA